MKPITVDMDKQKIYKVYTKKQLKAFGDKYFSEYEIIESPVFIRYDGALTFISYFKVKYPFVKKQINDIFEDRKVFLYQIIKDYPEKNLYSINAFIDY
jgi:hypothetical protein